MNHYYYFKKLAVWELKHSSAIITFTTGGNPTGSMSYIKQRYKVTFSFKRDGDEYSVPIGLIETPCHFGGKREWFVCPACQRRCGTLYIRKSFACHKCYDVLYGSQSDEREDKYLRIAQNIRKRLGGDGNLTKPLPKRPKGMHHQTYNRLEAAYYRAVDWNCVIVMAKFGLLKAIMKDREPLDLSDAPSTDEIMHGANYFETDDETLTRIEA